MGTTISHVALAWGRRGASSSKPATLIQVDAAAGIGTLEVVGWMKDQVAHALGMGPDTDRVGFHLSACMDVPGGFAVAVHRRAWNGAVIRGFPLRTGAHTRPCIDETIFDRASIRWIFAGDQSSA